MNIISSLTASTLGALRYMIAVDLVIVFFWTLAEISVALYRSTEYHLLFLIPAVSGPVLLGVLIWRWAKPEDFGETTASNGSLNLLPFALLDAGLLLATVWVANSFGGSYKTPLLLFSQTLLDKVTS
jgi:hypothetical protein